MLLRVDRPTRPELDQATEAILEMNQAIPISISPLSKLFNRLTSCAISEVFLNSIHLLG